MKEIKDLLVTLWYGKFQIIGRIISFLIFAFAITGILYSLGVGITCLMEEKIGNNGIQVWDYMPDRIRHELTNLDIEHGNVIHLGMTIKKGQAVKFAKEQTERFNRDVDNEFANVKHGFQSKPHPAFTKKADLYYVDNEEGKMLFFVPRGAKVKQGYEKIELEY